MTDEFKRRIYTILTDPAEDDRTGQLISNAIMLLIILNITSSIMESVDSVSVPYAGFFYYFELISVIIFSAEYLLRLWACPVADEYSKPISGRLKLMGKPMYIVDLLAILPFYIQALFPGMDLRFLRVLRLFRIIRLFRSRKLRAGMALIVMVLQQQGQKLIMCFAMMAILVVLSANIMYLLESEAQPEGFSSIPAAMWWSVITVTTIGYGDLFPITVWGKLFASLVSFVGICAVALPIGILGSGLIEAMGQVEEEKSDANSRQPASGQCPHCGKSVKLVPTDTDGPM